MSTRNVIILLFYDGKLRVEDDIPIYEGGIRRPIRVQLSSTLGELKEMIYGVTKYNRLEFRLKLTYKFPGHDSVVVEVVDDDICSIMLEQCVGRSLSLYIEKEPVALPHVEVVPSPRDTSTTYCSYSSEFISARQPSCENNRLPDMVHRSSQPDLSQHCSHHASTQQPSQSEHRSLRPDDGNVLHLSSHFRMVDSWTVQNSQFIEYLEIAGFAEIRHLRWIRLDPQFITALVERWHPETNTFHLPHGEMTITLQDVAMILGLHVHGDAVIAPPCVPSERWSSWRALCKELLGEAPEPPYNMGQSGTCVQLTWLRDRFGAHADELSSRDDKTILFHTRAYIMCLLGAVLLPDTSGNEIHLQYLPLLEDFSKSGKLSWGSAVLAYLYRQLSKGTKGSRNRLGGCLHLLQLWSWEHLHVGRPSSVPSIKPTHHGPLGCRWNIWWKRSMPTHTLFFYRNEIDLQDESQFTWEPYTKEIMARVSSICVGCPDTWLAHVPLLCMSVMEIHVPQRVLRQFGKVQYKPQPMEPYKRVDGRGRANVNWVVYYADYISRWNERSTHIIKLVNEDVDDEVALQDYYQWYKSRTVPYLAHPRQELPTEYYPRGPVECGLLDVTYHTRELLVKEPDSKFTSTKRQILQLQEGMLRQLHIHVPQYDLPHTTSSAIMTPGASITRVPPLPSAIYMQSLRTNSGRTTLTPPAPIPDELPSSSYCRPKKRRARCGA